MKNKYYLAIDIGASSGRHIVGFKDEDGFIKTDEVFRFKNGVREEGGHLTWDIETLFKNVVCGIKAAFEKYPQIESLAVDTWGCDYVLLNGDKEIFPCYAYRDCRTRSAIDKVHAKVPFEKLYKKTGIQFQPFNTLYQLYSDKESGRLDGATDFLMIPEYISYKLTGIKKKEYTDATTTGLINAETKVWDGEIIKALNLPERLFAKPYKPKTFVGELLPEIQQKVLGNCKVVLCASHDTASAVEGIYMRGNQPYISSGTWSLLGVKVKVAITDEGSLKANYSNEGGVGYIRYQKNIMGVWVVNRLKEELCPEKDFADIITAAALSKYSETCDINLNEFLAPDSMVNAFENNLKVKPASYGDYFRCAFLSLTKSYKTAIEELERNTGKSYKKIYIVGGGAKNALLNIMTADITGKEVTALPIEATAIGNLKIQSEVKSA